MKNKKESNEKYDMFEFDDNDINEFELKYKLKALNKNKKPSKHFINWLTKDNSHVLKKTVVELEKDDLYKNSKIKNISYEKALNSNEFEKTIANLITEAQNINNDNNKKQEIQDKIKKLLLENLNNKNLTMNTNLKSLDINAQNDLLDNSENYIAYVYYFWSPETMNFKIIGLHSINALFEFANIKQTFYLIKPAMITNDCPIYFCFDKVPYSISFDIKDDLIKLTTLFLEKGTTSDIFYFMEKNKTFIRVYGFNKLPLSIWIEFILFLGFCLMLEYIIIMSYIGK